MRYACLVLDHDDTVVRSTPEIHYPSFLETMRLLRPERLPLTLEQFIAYSFDPGFLSLCRDILKFTDAEMDTETEIWQRSTQKIPDCYAGFESLLPKFRENGGRICVVSHSERRVIERDYEAHFGFVPDRVFGWERPEHQRKPHAYPLDEIMAAYAYSPKDILVVDDLKLGLDMAKKRKVDFAWAGWSDTAFVTERYMTENANYCLNAVAQLETLLEDQSAHQEGASGGATSSSAPFFT